MDSSDIIFEVSGARATITLNRPRVFNALTMSMYSRLADICDEIDGNENIRVVLFTSSCGKAFAAGTDIHEFLDFSSGEDGVAYEREIAKVLGKLADLRPVSIALIQGACTGGGAAISMTCDLRYATPDLRFGYPIAKTLGNCLSSHALELMLDSIGVARTKELLLTAGLLSADKALDIGLVNDVFPRDSIESRVGAICDDIGKLAPLAINAIKQGINRVTRHRAMAEDAMDDLILSVYGSRDFHGAVRSFLKKEPPTWSGR